MKTFARFVPAILFTSVASLSLIAFTGCSDSSSGNQSSAAAKNIYVVEKTNTNDIEQDSVAVFSSSATGSTTPSSTLTLPSNFRGYAVAVGPQGQIYVGGEQVGDDTDQGQILEYAAGASGMATPTVTLNGAEGSFDIPDSLAVNSAGTLFVAADDGSLEAFPSGFTASSAPTQHLTWGEGNFYYDGDPIGVDTAGDVFYMDEYAGPDYDGLIEVFAAGTTGATAPIRTITGTDTNSFYYIYAIAVDGAGDVYTANYNEDQDPNDHGATKPGSYAANRGHAGPRRTQQLGSHSHLTAHPHDDPTYESTGIIEFAAGANGNATPLKRIGGAEAATNLTGIVEPLDLAVDAASNLYYADANGGFDSDNNPSVLLEVFPPSATGNVAPAATFTSTNFTYENTQAVAIH